MWDVPATGEERFPKDDSSRTDRNELQECAALARAIRHGDLDRIMIPDAPLDILAQQIVAICAAGADSEARTLLSARMSAPVAGFWMGRR